MRGYQQAADVIRPLVWMDLLLELLEYLLRHLTATPLNPIASRRVVSEQTVT